MTLHQSQLFVFNSSCEMAVENDTLCYSPPSLLKTFEQDIAPIMGFLGDSQDYLYRNSAYDNEFIAFWKLVGKTFPKPVSDTALKQQKLNAQLLPWGWSKTLLQLFAPLCTIDKEPYPFLNTGALEFKNLFSRLTSFKIAHQLKKHEAELPELCIMPHTPERIDSENELYAYFNRHNKRIVLKTLWSASGRGVLMLRNDDQWHQAQPWIKRQLKLYSFILVEPYIYKVQDASFLLEIDKDGCYHQLGINYCEATENGKFIGESLSIPSTIKEELPTNTSWEKQLGSVLIQTLSELGIHKTYKGAIGIDMLFYKDKQGQLRLMPFIEANLRINMGLINHHIKPYFHTTCNGKWIIQRFESGEWNTFCDLQLTINPIVISDKKISKGFFPLSPKGHNTTFAAWGIAE